MSSIKQLYKQSKFKASSQYYGQSNIEGYKLNSLHKSWNHKTTVIYSTRGPTISCHIVILTVDSTMS